MRTVSIARSETLRWGPGLPLRLGSQAAMAPGENQAVNSPLSLRVLSYRLQLWTRQKLLYSGVAASLMGFSHLMLLAFGGEYEGRGIHAATPLNVVANQLYTAPPSVNSGWRSCVRVACYFMRLWCFPRWHAHCRV